MGKIYRYLYIVILLIFLVWMIFLDTHSLKIHRELNQEIEKLETQKKELIDLVKSKNLIDIRTPSFLNVRLNLNKKSNLVELNKRIKNIRPVFFQTLRLKFDE